MGLFSGYNWKTKRILVVEDDESSAHLIGEILKDTGASISYSTDGNEAVDFIREHPDTDLVLMDVHLPNKDGFTASREIKKIASNVIIIAQTAYTFAVDNDEAIAAGCDEFMTKPLNPALLLDKINTFLS